MNTLFVCTTHIIYRFFFFGRYLNIFVSIFYEIVWLIFWIKYITIGLFCTRTLPIPKCNSKCNWSCGMCRSVTSWLMERVLFKKQRYIFCVPIVVWTCDEERRTIGSITIKIEICKCYGNLSCSFHEKSLWRCVLFWKC